MATAFSQAALEELDRQIDKLTAEEARLEARIDELYRKIQEADKSYYQELAQMTDQLKAKYARMKKDLELQRNEVLQMYRAVRDKESRAQIDYDAMLRLQKQ